MPAPDLVHVSRRKRKIQAQRATVRALLADVNRAIIARDDAAGQEAHDSLFRAEWRLLRMEAPEPDDDFDVLERD